MSSSPSSSSSKAASKERQESKGGVGCAAAYLGDNPPEGSERCSLRRDLFTYCSYCSSYVGSGSGAVVRMGAALLGAMMMTNKAKDRGIRCSDCGWVYCADCVISASASAAAATGDEAPNAHLCLNCVDRYRWISRPIEVRNSITTVRSIVVAGSGIGGLASALSLKRRGVPSVTVLEKAPCLRDRGGAITVQTNAMRALLDIDPGVMAAVYDAAGALNDDCAFKTYDERMILYTKLSGVKESRWGNPESRCIVRGMLQKLLCDACVEVGVEILFGHAVTDVDEESKAGEGKVLIYATVEEGDGRGGEEASEERAGLGSGSGSGSGSKSGSDENTRELTADLLVAADGIWSKIRRSIFPDAPEPVYAGYQMIVGVAPRDEFDQRSIDCWGERWGVGNRFGFFRCGDGGTATYYARTCPADADKDMTPEELKRIVVDGLKRHGYDSRLVELASTTDPSRGYRYVIRHMPALHRHVSARTGRVVLLGDAANGMPPNLGQGACMALESASVLSQALLSSDTLAEAMDKYERRRVKRTALVARKAKESGDMFQASNALTAALRNAIFGYLGRQSNKKGPNVAERDLPDPFGYLFSYRLMSWPVDQSGRH